MLLSCILLMWNPKGAFSGEKIYILFLVSGICLAYFDFLTAPTITLTIPLALICLREKQSWKTLLKWTLYWLAGYAGMWAGKWVISLILQSEAFFRSLTDHFALWTAEALPNSTKITRIGALNANFEVLFQDLVVNLLLISYVILVAAGFIRNMKKLDLKYIDTTISLFFPALIPVLWILIMASHSVEHTFFTYRTLAPCVFCMLCGLDIGNITGSGQKDIKGT